MIRLAKLGRSACPQRFLSITGSFAKFEDGDNAIDKVLTSKVKARMMQTVKQMREESEVTMKIETLKIPQKSNIRFEISNQLLKFIHTLKIDV